MGESNPRAGIPIGANAEQLGVTIELLLKRAQRGTIPAYKADGRWFIVLDGTESIVRPEWAGQDRSGQRRVR
jgi:hypothetical protein